MIRVPPGLAAAIATALAAISVAACTSSSTPTTANSSPAISRPSAPAATSSAPAAPDATRTNVKVESMVPGTKAICAALTQNSELNALVGTNASHLKYASGTVTNNVFGLNKVPGCQIGIDPTATDVTVAWAFCRYPGKGFTDAGPIGGTSNVYNFAGTANGVIIIIDASTSIGILTGTAGTRSVPALVQAAQNAAKIWQANGGCSSS